MNANFIYVSTKREYKNLFNVNSFLLTICKLIESLHMVSDRDLQWTKTKLCQQSFVFTSFSLQFLAFDTEASHDILKVWDGPPENEMSLKEVSGSLLPEGIHSTLNIVTIQFETDFYITKSGFAIDFSSEYILRAT